MVSKYFGPVLTTIPGWHMQQMVEVDGEHSAVAKYPILGLIMHR